MTSRAGSTSLARGGAGSRASAHRTRQARVWSPWGGARRGIRRGRPISSFLTRPAQTGTGAKSESRAFAPAPLRQGVGRSATRKTVEDVCGWSSSLTRGESRNALRRAGCVSELGGGQSLLQFCQRTAAGHLTRWWSRRRTPGFSGGGLREGAGPTLERGSTLGRPSGRRRHRLGCSARTH